MLLICSTKNRHGNQPLHRLCRSSMEPGFSRASRLLPVAASAAAASLDCPFSADGSGGGRSPARLGRAGGVCEEAARTFPIFPDWTLVNVYAGGFPGYQIVITFHRGMRNRRWRNLVFFSRSLPAVSSLCVFYFPAAQFSLRSRSVFQFSLPFISDLTHKHRSPLFGFWIQFLHTLLTSLNFAKIKTQPTNSHTFTCVI